MGREAVELPVRPRHDLTRAKSFEINRKFTETQTFQTQDLINGIFFRLNTAVKAGSDLLCLIWEEMAIVTQVTSFI